MTSKTVTRRVAVLALMGITLLGVSACDSSAPETPTSTSSSPSKKANVNGNDVQVTAETDGKVSWNVYAKDGFARGTVKITVGGWSTTSDEMTGSAYPAIHVGTYTGTITYTNPDGGTITESFAYTLQKANASIASIKQIPSPAVEGAPITLETQVKGNALLTGTVTATETVSDTVLGEAAVNEDGIAVITFTPEKTGGTINVRLTYSGDADNNETSQTRVITLTN